MYIPERIKSLSGIIIFKCFSYRIQGSLIIRIIILGSHSRPLLLRNAWLDLLPLLRTLRTTFAVLRLATQLQQGCTKDALLCNMPTAHCKGVPPTKWVFCSILLPKDILWLLSIYLVAFFRFYCPAPCVCLRHRSPTCKHVPPLTSLNNTLHYRPTDTTQ